MARRPSSVRPSVCKLLRKSLLLAEKWPDRIATKLAHDGLQVSMHQGCGQGQRSRDMRRLLSWILGMNYSVN